MRSPVVASIASIALASITLAACTGQGPQWIGASPSWRGEARGSAGAAIAAPAVFSPVSAPAARYNEGQTAAPHTELGDAVIAAVRDAALAARLPVPLPDARLFRACAELADLVLQQGMVGYPVIEFALQRQGIIEPAPELLIVWGDVGSPGPIVQELSPRLTGVLRDGATARLGVGAAHGATAGNGVVVFALQGSGVSTLPIPRTIGAGGRVTLDAVLDPRFHDPEVFVTHQDGGTQQVALAAGRPGGFVAGVECGAHHGREQIEITASDTAGATVLANFPVWCGEPPPASVAVEPLPDEAPIAADEAERRLLASLNRDRGAAGLPALQWDGAVAAVARAYSEEMRRTHMVAHISPTSGSAADRVRAAGIKTGVVLENVARAYGIDEAHQALMNSPGHRSNLMSAVATHVGIGVAFGDTAAGRHELFLTQVFTRVPPVLDRAQALAAVRQKLAAARPVPATAGLDRLAQQLADGLAAGKSPDAAYQAIGEQVNGLARLYQRIGRVISAVADLDRVDGAGLLGGDPVDELGVGIAQGPHPEIGDNAIWIVVLLANRRAH
ncbi:MAG TPA: CAP domain-containing protein [Kofleriaceae bacterium]|jgi:uncharacterized protein YkwD|nr:CAP domain-containing protein [Kofleriaceae bacterium]